MTNVFPTKELAEDNLHYRNAIQKYTLRVLIEDNNRKVFRCGQNSACSYREAVNKRPDGWYIKSTNPFHTCRQTPPDTPSPNKLAKPEAKQRLNLSAEPGKLKASRKKQLAEPAKQLVPSSARTLIQFAKNSTANGEDAASQSLSSNSNWPVAEEVIYDSADEWQLLDSLDLSSEESNQHELINAPLLDRPVLERHRDLFPQYGLFGVSNGLNRFYLNTNTPLSMLVCGVQGSGKSHTVSTVLEECLIRDGRIGKLKAPLAAMICHVDPAGGAENVQPCEFAAISSSLGAQRAAATVFVSPSNYETMRKVYQAKYPNIQVRPLFLSTADLNAERMLTLMAFEEGDHMPLYMCLVQKLLRDIGNPFDYDLFRSQLDAQSLTPMQRVPLDIRLNLLDSFLAEQVAKSVPGYDPSSASSAAGAGSLHSATQFKSFVRPGGMVIVDLTDPFVDGGFAAAIFDIVVGLFVESKLSTGKILVFDEAHKYITKSDASKRLVDHLLQLIRQQRHIGLRTIISTQDPTGIPPSLLDLCPVSIVHRFSSPSWWQHLRNHLGSIDTLSADWFDQVVRLRTGDAMVFAPTGLQMDENEVPKKLGSQHVLIRIRQRITTASGQSRMAQCANIQLLKMNTTLQLSAEQP